jgi:hypothetical protein
MPAKYTSAFPAQGLIAASVSVFGQDVLQFFD